MRIELVETKLLCKCGRPAVGFMHYKAYVRSGITELFEDAKRLICQYHVNKVQELEAKSKLE